MYLKSIEVQGFKSFANKMTFKFNKGITAIVGPNGSGKSNVADAVRWVLGEQSAKQLRGAKMEDVIFSGTESRKPLGFAYVAITLDNSDHKLAIDYDEVTVARRVYRSGESEYLINRTSCRLKDVQELFFDTGIGKEGYSIIGQGQIDKILSGKPEERRELFDEAAGIVKFKKRKHAAEKSLEVEKQNLHRVNDILAELEKQIGPLKRQSETAREYLNLREHLKALDVNMYLGEYELIRSQLKEFTENLKIVEGDLSSTQQIFTQTKEEYERLEGQLEEYDQKLEGARNTHNESQLNREKLEGELKLINEQMNSSQLSLQTSEKRIEDLRQLISQRQEDLTKYDVQKKDIETALLDLQNARGQADATLKEMHEAIDRMRAMIEQKNGDIIGFLNEAANVKARLGRYDTMVEQINIRKAELNQRLIVLQSEEAANAEAVSVHERELSKIMDVIDQANTEHEQLQRQVEQNTQHLNEIRRLLSARQQDFHAVNSKYAALRNISERYEGYGNSIKRVMEQKQQYPGIVGVVADIIKVDKRYETAIEIALGGSIQNIVTDNELTAKKLIEYLKKNKFGRATFLPLTDISSKGGAVDAAVLKESGVIGLAGTLVEAEDQYARLVQYLLGRIIVVENIDQALALAKKYRYSLRIVTIDGESLSPGGSISGGAYKNSGNLLGRSRELDHMTKEIKNLRQEIDRLNSRQADLQKARNDNRQKLDSVAKSLQELSLSENTVRMTLNQSKAAKTASVGAHTELAQEMELLNQQIEDISVSQEQLTINLTDFEAKKLQTEQDIVELNLSLDQANDNEKNYVQEHAGLTMEFSNLHQKQEFIEEHIERIQGEIGGFEEENAGINQIMAEGQAEIELKHQMLTDYQATIVHLDEVIRTSQESLQQLTAMKEEISRGHKEFFARREELSDHISRLDKEQFRLNQQREKLEESRTAQSNYMWEEYELTYNSAIALGSEELAALSQAALKKAVVEQRVAIKKLGDVNVNAIEEYKNVSERYTLLKTQHDDLIEAEEKLNGIIESLDKAMREQFIARFKEIAVNFDRVFKELFGGGKGTLELMEDEDILYAGVRIIASPPGKKLQNMMQLSGGEKALTAIALLFAIQSLKPSPFCLLDEIEAALDDANVKRYAQYLHNLTEDTQFIIITHRRGTMNAADVLYGITMQEKGVSTLVSVSLIDGKLDD